MHYQTLKKLRIFILLGVLLSCLIAGAQTPIPPAFSPRLAGGNIKVKGDVIFVGNNILNRAPSNNPSQANIPLNDDSDNNGQNMEYIDIDGDPSTFSSSSANLSLASSCDKVVYAGLYWASTYPYERSTNGGQQWTPSDATRFSDFNQVKFKVPGGSYVTLIADNNADLPGEDDSIIFDGKSTGALNQSYKDAPIVCYKNVTSLVQALANANGSYTLANLRAAKGQRDGSSSAGWVMVVIYENPTLPGKFISTFDGYQGVSNSNTANINISGFVTLPNPFPVNARLGVGALEGDKGLQNDRLQIKGSLVSSFTDIGNSLNPTNNFFNSTITNNNAQVPGRNPYGTNTLGLDLDMLDIPNTNNSVIKNNETAATLKLTTSGDGYGAFVVTFAVDIIEPDIKLVKTVENTDGDNIAGQNVNLSDILDYVVTFDNEGNDDAKSLVIKDILPINTSFVSVNMDEVPGGSYTYDAATGTIYFTIPDNLVKKGNESIPHSIRLRVKVAESCNDLTDACSNLIQNTAYATYHGVLNTTTISDDPSVAGLSTCGSPIEGPANFLVDVSACIYSREEVLCNGTLTLTGGSGYGTYEWFLKDPGGDLPMGNTQSITVVAPGEYYYNATPIAPCIVPIREDITVTNFTGANISNPVIPFANETVTCTNNGLKLPKIFLCGINDSRVITTGISSGTVKWQKLNTTTCTTVVPDSCPHNGCPSTSWTQVATGPNFTATDAGEYRIYFDPDGTGSCPLYFYFNVYKNNLDPQVQVQNIVCNTPGQIRVINVPNTYEIKLIKQSTNTVITDYPNVNPVFSIASPGAYTVEIKQTGVPNGCTFTIKDITVLEKTLTTNIIPTDKTCNIPGSIRVQALNVSPQYYFSISGPVNITHGPETDNNHLFSGLNAGTYTVDVTTDDGCTSTNTVTINDYSNLALNATVTQHVSCDPGIITVTESGGLGPYSYAIYSIDGTLKNPTAADYITENTFSIDLADIGTYVFVVVDANNCSALSNPVTINNLPGITYTTASQDAICNGASNGSITVTVTSNPNGYGVTFELLDSSANVIATNTSGIFTGLAVGDYTVNILQASSTNTCSFSEAFTITEPNALTGTASITQQYTCANGGATISVNVASVTGGSGSGTYTYSIDGITFGAATTFTGLTNGTYTVTIKDGNGCTLQTAPMTVNPLTPVTNITFGATAVTCPAQTSDVTLTVTGGVGPFNYEITAPSAVNNGTSAVFTGLAPNTYTFKVTDANGCTFTKNYTINGITPISVTGQNIRNVSCFNAADGELTYTISGFGTNYNYTVASTGMAVAPATGVTSGTINLTNLAAGSYIITVTDPVTNCNATAAVTIQNPTAALAITKTVVQPTCIAAGSVAISATGGWGSYSYQLTGTASAGPQSSSTFGGLAAGNYTITVTDANGCAVTDTFALNAAVAPVLTVTAADVCLPGTSITVAVNTGTGLAPFQYSLNGGAYANGTVATGTTYTNLVAGTYTITVRDANGCTNSTTISRTINPQLTASTSLIKGITCNSVPPAIDAAQIAITINGGGASYQYEVSTDAGITYATPVTVTGSFTYTTTASGTYQFRITDAAGCTVTTAPRTIAPKVDPEFTFGTTTDVLCNGSSTGALTINIDNTKGLAPYTIAVTDTNTSTAYGTQTTGLPAGIYEVVLTDANGCTFTNTEEIEENDPVAFTTQETNIQCIDDPLNPGTNISAGEILVQAVTGGQGPYTYDLTNNFGYSASFGPSASTTHPFVILNYGIYQVVVTDANGCTAVKPNIIMASPPNELDIDVTTIVPATCADGGSAIVEVGAIITGTNYEFAILETNTPPYSANYVGPTDPSFPRVARFDNLVPGVNYTFVVYDKDTHCYYFDSAQIDPAYSDLVVDPLVVTDITCQGSNDGNVNFNFTVSSGTSNVSYQVYKFQSNEIVTTPGASGTVTVSGGTGSGNATGLAPGIYYIEFEQLDGNAGCKVASEQFTITESPVLLTITANATEKDNDCTTDAGQVVITGQGGNTPYSYQLVPAGDPQPTTWVSGNTFNKESGNYDAYIKDDNNCIKTVTVTIDLDESPEVTAVITPNTQCTATEGSFSIDVTRTKGDAGGYTYSLNGGAFEAQSDSFTYTGLTSGSYSVTIKDGNGCTYTIPVTDDVIIYAPLTVTAQSAVQPTCADDDGQITVTGFGGSGNYEYELEFAVGGTAAVQQSSNVFTGLAADDYKVIIHDITSTCTEDALVSLDAAILVDFTTAKTDVSCNGGNDGTITITLDASNTDTPYSYTIDGLLSAPIVQSSPLFTGLAADTYTITVTSGKNCTDTDTVTINEPVALAVSAVATPFACATDNTVQTSEITITATDGTSPYTYSINGTNYFTTNIFNVPDTGSVQNITVYVKDANNCTETVSLTIDQLPVMSAATATQVTEITCTNDETVTVQVTGGSGNYQFELLPSGPVFTPGVGVSSANFDLTTPDDYTFKVTDLGTQCTITTATYTVSPFDTIDAVATAATQVTCFGGTDGTVTINVSGYAGAYNYEVRNTSGVVASGTGDVATSNPLTITNVPAGSLFVRVIATDTPFCSADTAAITVASPADALVLSANQTASVTCTNNLGEILAQASGGWGTYEYELINTTTATPIQAYDANNFFTDLAAGNYTVNVRDAGGCIVTRTLTLTQPNPITASINASVTSVMCYGDKTASVQVTGVSDGSGTYQYILNRYDATGTTIVMSTGAQASPIFTGLGEGIYTITISDGWSCGSEFGPVTITQPDPLVGSLSLTDGLTCTTLAELTISATGGTAPYEYSTDNITYGPTTVFPNLDFGTYQYYVRDSNGCTAVMTNEVTIPEVPALNPNLNLAGAKINCYGAATAVIVADATGGLGNYQYELLDSTSTPIAGPQATGTFSGLLAGDYYVRVISDDCSTTSNIISITNPPEFIIDPHVTNIQCYGQSNGSIEILTTGGTGTIQYAISPNLDQFDTNNLFTGLAKGFYDIIVQDQNGCFELIQREIVEPGQIEATIVNVTDETCLGESDATIEVTITGGTGSYVISIDDITYDPVTGSTHILTGLSAGTTFIYVKDANDCSLFPAIEQPILPGVNMDPQVVVTPTCVSNTPNNDVTITIDGSVTAANVTYSLDGVTYQPSNIFLNIGSTPGTYTAYAKHIVPATGLTCIQTEDFTIDTHDPIAATAAVTADVLCYGDSTGEITVTATGGTTQLEYAISPLFVYQLSDTFSNLASGTYDIKVKDAIGCEIDITGIVVDQPTAALTATATHTDEICINADNGSITVTPTDGTAPYQVSLNGGTYTTASSAPAVFTGLADGTYTIDVRDANGCIFAQFTETINEGVDLQASIVTAQVCDETTITVDVNPAESANVTYYLDGALQASNVIVATGLTSGTHTVTVTHSNTCSASFNFTVAPVIPIVMGATSQTDVNCFGGSDGTATATATGGTAPLNYAIAPNVLPLVYGTYQATGAFTGLAAGDYIINVKDALGCELASSVITVGQPAAALTATATSTDEICINANDGTITITPTDGTGPYQVSLNGGAFTTPPSAGPITISNLSDTTYTIDVRDANGCTYTLPAAITIAEGVDIQGDYQIIPTCTNNVIGNIVFPTVNPNIPASDFECALDGGIFEPADSTFYQDLSAGSHTITFRYLNGCTQDVTFTVPALLPISASITSQTNVLCYGNTTGEITVTATGGTGTLSYAISDQTPPVFGTYQGTGVFTGLVAGDYTISIMDDNVGCETQVTTTIIEPTAALTATASSTNEICINANDGTITIVPSGGTAPYETSLNGSAFAAQLSYTGLADAAYTIDVRDANGCTYTLPAAITIAEGVDMQPVATVTPTCVSNTPDNDVTIAINPAVPASDVTYSIDGTNYQSSNTFTGVNLAGGTYTAYAQNVNGCIQTTTFTIIDRLPVAATAAVTADVLCYGATTGEITVTATGGTTPLEYAISSATPPVFTTYQPSNVFAGLAAGDYTISVRDAIGCEVVTTVLTVTQPTAALTATASSTNEICINANDGTITIVPTGGTAPYETSLNGSAFAAQLSYTGLSDATYTIDVRDANGCTYTLPAAITIAEGVDMQPVATVTPTCVSNTPDNDVTVAINPAVPASNVMYSIDGTNYQASNTFTGVNLAGGTYTAYAQNVNGCIQTTTFTIIDRLPVAATAAVTADVLCYDDATGEITITATGGTTPLEYAISSATPPVFTTYQPSNVFAGLAAGDYTISVRDAIGCEVVTTMLTVTQPTAALTATASHTDEICINANDGTITIVPSGGTAPYETSLNGSAFAAQLSYTGLSDAAYTIDVRDANGCTYTLPAAITIAEGVDMQPVATVTPTCVSNTPDNDVTVAINPAVPASNVMYSIDGTNYQASNTFTGVNLAGGTYTAYAQNVNGCIQTTTFTIIDRLPVAATAAVTADVLCYGDATGEITITATGGTTPLEYAISSATPPVFTTYQPSNVFAGLAAGDYTISVRDAIGCEVVTTMLTVTQPTAALTATASHTDEICINANDGTITIVPSGGTAPYETSLNGSAFAAQLSYTGLSDAAYTIDVRDANGCTYTLPAAITIAEGVDMQPVATVTPTCVSNTPDNDVTIAINPAVPASDVTYSIDGTNYQASNTFTGVNLAGGTYTAYAQNVNGCIQTTTFTIIDRLPVAATAAVTADVLCYGDTTGEITVTASGGTTPLEYAISSATPPVFTTYQPSNVFAGLAAGDYTISVRDAIGCEVVTTVLTVTQPAAALTATASATNEICINANDGTITIVPTGGTAPYETSLNGSAFAAQLSYTGLADATYSIDISDANGCTYTLPAAITIAEGVDMQPVATVTPTCVSNTPDNDVTIAINPAVPASDVTYSIDGTNYQASNIFTDVNLAGGTYTAYAQNVNGCIQTTTFTIIDRLPVAATAAVTADVLCYGATTGEITVTATGGTTPLEYAISTATPPVFTTYQPSNVFAGLAAGDYTISVRDATGCEVVTTVLTVTQPTAALAVTVSKTDEQCLNANDGTITIVATGGTAPYQSRIDSAAAFTAQMNYTALADGIYDVEVVDANGCSYTEQITIATGIQIQPSLLVTQQCTETTIEVSVNPAVVADVMYSLDGGTPQSSNTFVVDGLDPAVTHTITVTHIQGCSEAVDFNINPVIPIVMSAPTVTDVACHGKDVGAIQVNATGGTGPLQYAITWNIWPTPIYGPSNNFTDLLAGQYTLWVKDAMGCVVTTTVDVLEPAEALTLSAVATAESCINSHDGTITITPQGGVAPYYTAIISAVNFQQDVLTYSGLFGGTYDVYVRDANGCYAKTTVTIEKGVNLNPYIETTLSCDNNNPVNTVTVLLNPVVQNMEYSLTGAPGSYTANNVFDLAPGSYTVYVKHINGCTAQLDFTVQDRPAVAATASSVDATCNGVDNGSVTVTASGGTGTLKYGISPDFTMTQNPVFNNLLAGNYTIRVEDAYGCYTEVSVVVNEPTAITVTVVDVLQEICVNDDNGVIEVAIAGGTGPYATSLTPNGAFVEDQTLFDNLDGGVTYTIYVKDANGCITTMDVPLDAPMDINATTQVVYNCNENTVTILTDGNIDPTELTYTIEGPKGNNPPQTSNVFTNLQDGTYTVEVLHISGCTDTTSFTIESTDELTLLLAESGLNQFKASAFGGKGPYTYTFEGNDMGTKNTFVYDHSGTYEVTVTDSRGCTTKAFIEVKFIDIIIPDVITPGGDGQNDTWSPGNTQNYPNINTDIFDRYGRKVATLRQGQVWDGKYDGNELPTGDYWYLIKLGDAENREFVGHFTIYR